ncbi:MAG: hypothetical protein WC761_01990 [Candidatus Paceibacterota bacterium]|jgi:hypothetical protein
MALKKLPKLFWQEQIKVLEEYSKKKGWSVSYNNKKYGDSADWEGKAIALENSRNKERLFYVFLHELGHMQLMKNNTTYNAKYDNIFDNFASMSQVHRLTRVEEEYDAWRAGYKIAQRLDLYVEAPKFEKIRAKYLMTYIMWVVKQQIKKKVDHALECQLKTIKAYDAAIALKNKSAQKGKKVAKAKNASSRKNSSRE